MALAYLLQATELSQASSGACLLRDLDAGLSKRWSMPVDGTECRFEQALEPAY